MAPGKYEWLGTQQTPPPPLLSLEEDSHSQEATLGGALYAEVNCVCPAFSGNGQAATQSRSAPLSPETELPEGVPKQVSRAGLALLEAEK